MDIMGMRRYITTIVVRIKKKRLNELSSKYSMEAIITYCNRRKIDEIANLDFFFRGYYHQSVLFIFFCDRNGKIRTDSFLF